MRPHQRSSVNLSPPTQKRVQIPAHVSHTHNSVSNQLRQNHLFAPRRVRADPGNVHMHIPQSRNQEFPASLNHSRIFRNAQRPGRPHRRNPSTGNHHRLVRLRRPPRSIDHRHVCKRKSTRTLCRTARAHTQQQHRHHQHTKSRFHFRLDSKAAPSGAAQYHRRPASRLASTSNSSESAPLPVKYLHANQQVKDMALKKPKSITHNGKRLSDILDAHERFFRGKEGGEQADLAGADLSHADLQGVNLSGAILRHANLESSDLRRAKLPHADFSGANLHEADLRNTDMTEAVLPGADLSEAQASGVEFFRCDLRNVNLRAANVRGAKFTGADMGIAILRETDLSGADLSGVDLSTTLLPRGYAAKKSA